MKSYLDALGRKSKFKRNFPGYDWGMSFLKRHPEIRQRVAENMKRARAKVSHEIVEKFFNNLEPTVEGVPPENIINYDESAFVNDPGKEKVVVRRGTKYPSKITEHSRVSVSVMVSGTASGDFLPPYVVYKSDCLWSTWVLDGIHGARYNRTKSGWFDQRTFEDWFHKIAFKYLKNLPGKKIMIGDNLASHLSLAVIRKCERHNIHFVLLPPNATHLYQPLDVAVFRPLKIAWRRVLTKWKKNPDESAQYKENFPRLMKDTLDSVGAKGRNNLISGFRAAGIYPFSKAKGLSKLPQRTPVNLPPGPSSGNDSNSSCNITPPNESVFHDTLVGMLSKERFKGPDPSKRGRRKKIQVSPGKSVLGIHFGETEPAADSSDDEDDPEPLHSSSAEDSDDSTECDLAQHLPSSDDEIGAPDEDTGMPSTDDEMEASDEDTGIVDGPITVPELRKGPFVIVTLDYSAGRKEQTRKYLGQVKSVERGGKNVEVSFMKKYLNRCTDFVFVTPYNDAKPEKVPFEKISGIVRVPFKEVRGRFIFDRPIMI